MKINDCLKSHRENRNLIIRVEVECITVRRYVQIEGTFGSASEKDIEKWVNSHLSELMEEWDMADDPKGRR